LLNFWCLLYRKTPPPPIRSRNFGLSFKTWGPDCFVYMQNSQV
jgi:hypothetical protein